MTPDSLNACEWIRIKISNQISSPANEIITISLRRRELFLPDLGLGLTLFPLVWYTGELLGAARSCSHPTLTKMSRNQSGGRGRERMERRGSGWRRRPTLWIVRWKHSKEKPVALFSELCCVSFNIAPRRYTTQAGSTILFFNVVPLCEVDELLFNMLIPNYCFFARDIF